MTTLRDALANALSQSESGTLEAPVETPIDTAPQDPIAAEASETAEQAAQRARDERGRFARQEAQAEAKPEAPTEPAEPRPVRRPPSSWKKDYWQQWERLGGDPELSKLQDYIEQRESEAAKGVSQYKQQYEQVAPLYKAIEPFVPELRQYGIQPEQWITNLGTAHRTLATGTPEQKLQMFAKLATDYGVPLQGLTGQPVDPQFGMVTETVSALQRELNSIKSQQAQLEQARLQEQIESFKANAPFFEEVRDTMAGLLQAGVVKDLQAAYEKAVRLNDDVWQKQQAEEHAKAEAERRAAIAQKKAVAVSPKSSSPTGAMVNGGGKKGLREQLSEAFDSASTGRF